ncbi:MAG: MerR family transcriptional regulator [Aureliella sp.]
MRGTDVDYLSCSKAAELMGVSRSTVLRYCEVGEIRSHSTLGGHRRIEAGEVTRWLSGKQSKSRKRSNRSSVPLSRFTSQYVADQLLVGKLSKLSPIVDPVIVRKKSVCWLVDNFLSPAMSEIGARWVTGGINYADERRATTNIRLLFRQLSGARRTSSPNAIAVGATLEGDYSDLASTAIELAALELEMDAFHVGANLPVPTLAQVAQQLGAQVVWVSYCHIQDPESTIEQNRSLREMLPNGVRLAIGGGALYPELLRQMDYDFCGRSCADFQSYLKPFRV